MKLPEKLDFGINLIFRLLLPGGILTLGLLPVLYTLVDLTGWINQLEYISVIVVILMGCIIALSDTPIYMVFEGGRYWPTTLWRLAVKSEEKRLTKIQNKKELFRNEDRRRYLEALVDLRAFPATRGKYEAQFPTRLGNLMAAYEGYSYRVYGMDAVFYWYRIWLKLDKDLREEVDNQQSIADGAVFTAFASFFAGLVWFMYSLLLTSQILINKDIIGVTSYFFVFKNTLLGHLPSVFGSLLISLIFLLSGCLLYRVSIYLHAQFGETFKSVFDDYQKTIDVSEIIQVVSELSNDFSLISLNRKEQLKVAWRYLQFNGFLCRECKKLIPMEELREHKIGHSEKVESSPLKTLVPHEIKDHNRA
jgi:hypothetical protein